ncbi:MAG TPA: EamA family transporter [Coriobacteriia bacterium]|nr:EamA family transporter [Coriobacteriia bacterium]
MPTSAPSRIVPLLCLAGTVFFWGTSFAATKVALDSFSPMAVIWLRMAVATLAFLPFWRLVPRPEYRAGDWRLLALAAVCIPCLYYLLEGFAVRFTTSGQAGVISAIVPLIVAAGAWMFLNERLTWQGGVAIAASLVGVAVLSSTGLVQETAPHPVLGNLLELAAMIAAAGSMLAIKHLSARYNPWLLTGMQAVVGAVFFAPLLLATPSTDWTAATAAAWVSVAYLGTFASLGAFGLYNTALKGMPATRAALSLNLIPAVAVFAGWAVRDEAMLPVQLAACALIVGAVVFGEVAGRVPAEEDYPR